MTRSWIQNSVGVAVITNKKEKKKEAIHVTLLAITCQQSYLENMDELRALAIDL